MRDGWKPDAVSRGARFLACQLLLFQAHLAAGELSDPFFFIAATVVAAVLGEAASAFRFRLWFVFAICGFVPFFARPAIGLAAAAFRIDPVAADSVLLVYDRNLLIALPAFCCSALAAYAAKSFRSFLRVEPFVNGAALAIFFLLIDARTIPVYEKPIVLAALVAIIVFLEFIVLSASVPALFRISGRERFGVAFSVAAMCVVAVAFILKPFEEKAAAQGGGLIKPSMFRFDFSQYLRLESEISLSDDLVLIVRKDPEDQHGLIRRFVLSDYDRKNGFRRLEGVDEKTHPLSLPEGEQRIDSAVYKASKTVGQEYYLVNFDSSAFIAMNQPTKVVPYKSWDASSFTSVYAAESSVSEALPFELIDASDAGGVEAARGALGPSIYAALTEYGSDGRIAELARSMVGGQAGYWDSVQAVYEHLKFGDYRYSLKPGIASDGDQLGRFLFDTKKGYCSYFAFSMTLLLRSLGIPARTAVGFFIDPASSAFDYYPVRADMAHAWVEVFFPGYGWMEYDPTTEQLAEGEEFRFSSGIAPEQFEKLMREILTNRDRLQARSAEDVPEFAERLPRLIGSVARFARERWLALILMAWLAVSLTLRGGLFAASLFTRDPRRAAGRLSAHALRRLEFAGYRRRREESLGEFAVRVDHAAALGFVGIVEMRSKALFGPLFARADLHAARMAYRSFSERYGLRVPLGRRLLAWLLPFAAMRVAARHALLPLAFACMLLPAPSVRAQAAVSAIDDPFTEIEALISAERWESAVDKLRNAERLFPNDSRYPITLGDLFAGRKLYNLAWDEYRSAERLDGNDPALLHKLATTAGRLNKDEYSAAYLERVVTLRPDDRDAVGDLAWMYFKLHRLREGEQFLLEAIKRLGSDPGFSMTLGTIYSDLYDYDSSRRWYMESIDEARRSGARTFEAVAQYNLSILEAKHYRYAEAFNRTELSLEAADRSSGHLARGELHLKRLEFAKTYAEYERAYELDISPLSKLNLADAYLNAGRLAEARSYAENALAVTDLSWMFNYGTNLTQYKRDIHDILSETYKGLANLERSYPRSGPIDAVKGLISVVRFEFKAAGHRALFNEYARRCAVSYGAAGQPLDALLNYYDAFASYRKRASSYLREAQDLERSLVPASVSQYELERGLLERSSRRIEAAIPGLDPVWQKDLTARAYSALATLYPQRSVESREAAERLFALNRGALRRAGIRLPVSLRLKGNVQKAGAMARTLSEGGFRIVETGSAPRFSLEIELGAATGSCSLSDTLRGTVLLRKTLSLPSLSGKDRTAFARALADAVFFAQ